MGKHALLVSAPLLAAVACAGCFKVDYKGDILFRCDPGEGPKACPEGYTCWPETPSGPQCYKECTRHEQCGSGTCRHMVQDDKDSPLICAKPDRKPDGPPLVDAGPDAPKTLMICEGHRRIGELGDQAPAFDLVSQADDSVVVVWLEPGGSVRTMVKNGPTWAPEHNPGLGEISGLSRVNAALDSANMLHIAFTYAPNPPSPPGPDPNEVHECVIDPTTGGTCSSTSLLYSDQSISSLDGFDFDIHGDNRVLGLRGLDGTGTPGAFFGHVDPAQGMLTDCDVPGGAIAYEHVRVVAGPTNVGSILIDGSGAKKWAFTTFQNGTGAPTPCPVNPTLTADNPSPAELALDGTGNWVHSVFETNAPTSSGKTPRYLSWPLAKVPDSPVPVAVPAQVVAGTSDIAVLGADVVVSAIPVLNTGPYLGQVFLKPGGDGTSFVPLLRPKPGPDPMPLDGSGTWTRIVTDGGRAHVLYDGFGQQLHWLYYFSCRYP